jgi:hypothetical protein
MEQARGLSPFRRYRGQVLCHQRQQLASQKERDKHQQVGNTQGISQGTTLDQQRGLVPEHLRLGTMSANSTKQFTASY